MKLGDKEIYEIEQHLSDQSWRLNNLYHIIDAEGKKVVFVMNDAQKKLYENIHTQNLVLKARQLGFTTFIDIYFLDCCLWGKDVEAGIIAHNREDAGKIFRRKIQYPYQNLNPALKSVIQAPTESKSEMAFNNGSVISVSTSMRSGTVTKLHISEFGKICAKYPEKAREIVTGALEAIHTETGEAELFIESTAEGKFGYFYDYCSEAQAHEQAGKTLTNMDFRFHFFPWFENPVNALPAPDSGFTPATLDYFSKIEGETGTVLSSGQRNWYHKKHKRLGDDMKREHPSTPAEAFDQSVQGAYFQGQLRVAREENRITAVPITPGMVVDTWWDLGMNDVMAIWFTQDVGREIHVIDYLEDSGEGFEYYARALKDKEYLYGRHVAPHDIAVRELGTGVSRWEAAKKVGLPFDRVPRVRDKMDSINAARNIFGICYFDELKCEEGLKRLENYRKEWNEHLQTYKNTPLHDENSNGADAFQTLAMGHNFQAGAQAKQAFQVKQRSSRGWT